MASWTTETTFKHNWETVALSALHKYPNPYNMNLMASDVISRHIDPNSGALLSSKLLTTHWSVFISGDLYAHEKSIIHPQQRCMVLNTHNLCLTSIVKADERLEYREHPDNPDWTLMRHTTTISTVPWIRSKIKKVSLENAAKGVDAIEWVVHNRLPQITSEISETLLSAIGCKDDSIGGDAELKPAVAPLQEQAPPSRSRRSLFRGKTLGLFSSLFNPQRILEAATDEHATLF